MESTRRGRTQRNQPSLRTLAVARSAATRIRDHPAKLTEPPSPSPNHRRRAFCASRALAITRQKTGNLARYESDLRRVGLDTRQSRQVERLPVVGQDGVELTVVSLVPFGLPKFHGRACELSEGGCVVRVMVTGGTGFVGAH